MANEKLSGNPDNFIRKLGLDPQYPTDERLLLEELDVIDPRLRPMVASSLRGQLARMTRPYNSILYKCESPIESDLACALFCLADLYRMDLCCLERPEGPPKTSADLIIIPQKQIEDYRIDFQLTLTESHARLESQFVAKTILVECDGHDFHERTKEQARRDRSRDRKLQALGFTILRFTGSEIFNDPIACGVEILENLRSPEIAALKKEDHEAALQRFRDWGKKFYARREARDGSHSLNQA